MFVEFLRIYLKTYNKAFRYFGSLTQKVKLYKIKHNTKCLKHDRESKLKKKCPLPQKYIEK